MKKSTKISTLFILLIVPISMGLIFGFTLVSNTESIELVPIDIGYELRTKELPIRGSFSQHDTTPGLMIASLDYYAVGDLLDWLILDDYTGETFFDTFELRSIGATVELWVQVDMAYPDGRDVPVVTDEQANYMLEEFEIDIAPVCNDYFGEPDFHNGSNSQLVIDGVVPEGTYEDNSGRTVILVSNIRDEAYYSRSYPYYIVGFYWSYFERQFDRNIISIDSADWENRVGDDAARPNLYEATVAHEYQHLIHDDYNPEDDIFMNEGCSMYAEPLCGYPIDWGSINSFLATPDNSLTVWGDQGDINILADYGQGLLWSIYLSDHYGGAEFISYFVKTGIPGIEGINNALNYFGATETFEEVFYDWTLANILHTNEIGNGKYNYLTIDLGCEDADPIRVYEVKRPWLPPTNGVDFGQTKTILHKNTDVYLVGSYGTDYFMLSGLSESMSQEFIFDGDDVAKPPIWTRVDQDGDGDLEWYSTTAGPEKDLSMNTIIDVPTGTVTLSFNTYFDIEELWDYGFVQISENNGETWISLENEYTTIDHDPDAYPTIVENLPGLTGSFGWETMNFNLTPYAGQTVLLSFRYMTDWGTENPGWWVDDIAVNDVLIDDADDLVVFTTPPLPETDFEVSIVDVTINNEIPSYTEVIKLSLDDITERGSLDLSGYIQEDGYLIVIVSPTIGPADYKYEITR
ncbi:MAG: immune inhibitor A [Candidatus Lokiarchaeota archaeon]|nr:immune inhibitor A [Candidatus Lokiarchaeota archaeon]